MLTVLIVTAITTLCICDLVVLGLLASWIYLNRSSLRSDTKHEAPVPEVNSTSAQSEDEELAQRRREYIAQERAFQSMMNFNAEQAYGMTPTPDTAGEE